jgi:DNA-binding HxlR family transcriptional regulator
MLGDRWSLLILRDMMLHGARTYNELLACPERIATNILASRLRTLIHNGIIAARPDRTDGRRQTYLLTAKGIDLAAVMAELVLWAARHERTGNQALVRQLEQDKERMVAEVRRRWKEEYAARSMRDCS